ncbi:hypothetical protein [Candidatus Nitrosocosmicus franklandus]|uniref:Uncharacterized protein n=1 Tax=Candidatus Nitrosocosmicus franklandianus TaxID=1798806 RepID=A0A484II70_9ARCH|nr:hypothetical protein [Candidatus Nitrosocosmicus franklandus]VFJ14588.1 conserved protein of unknown function [Candidatus Nitrosocosmicus franklandus]
MPSFNFFKRKGKDVLKLKDKKNDIPVIQSSPSPQNTENRLTIKDVRNLLDRIEGDLIQNILIDLDKTFQETNLIFQHIDTIAEDLKNEEIEVEEEKLAPLVKNTKNTIVRALKREASNIQDTPKNFDEFVKFKDSLDASINRFGEVTSSHSRIVNTFMKKHANSLRGDLKKISDISDILRDEFEGLSAKKKIIDDCRLNLLALTDNLDEKQKSEKTLQTINNNFKKMDEEIKRKENELSDLKSSSDYSKALKYLQEKEQIDRERKLLIEKLNRIASHLTKAANKYSYGLTKATVDKIDTIINNPSEIAYKPDISEYLNLVKEMKDSVMSNKISLKDAGKIMQYFDMLIDELPRFKQAILKLDSKIEKLKENNKVTILEKISQKEEERNRERELRITENQRKDEILRNNLKIEEQVRDISNVIEEQLQRLSNKNYKLISIIE